MCTTCRVTLICDFARLDRQSKRVFTKYNAVNRARKKTTDFVDNNAQRHQQYLTINYDDDDDDGMLSKTDKQRCLRLNVKLFKVHSHYPCS